MNTKTITMTIGLLSVIAITPVFAAADAKAKDVKGSCCVAMNTAQQCAGMPEKQPEPTALKAPETQQNTQVERRTVNHPRF